MTSTFTRAIDLDNTLPDHTQLPESDGTFVKNFQEHPQSILLTDSLTTVLQQLHPDEQYCIGQDCGIYWRLTEPPERGAEAPDWFYVPNVPPNLDGQVRRSYVLWQEYVAPSIVLEFVSGNGDQERDTTPLTGKFWVYEQAIRVPFYGIYEVSRARVEVYELWGGRYHLVTANELGRFPIHPLGLELGIWQGKYQNVELPWLRWWDADGNLLLSGSERAELERQEKELAQQDADEERQRADEERQRADEERQRADEERQRADEERQRADEERQRAEEERQRSDRLAAQLRALGIEPEARS